MALPYNPGTAGYGTPGVTLNSVSYIADDLKLDDPTKALESRTALGAPGRQVLIQDFITGSGTLQYATATTARPANGMIMAVDLTRAGANQNYVVSKVSDSWGNEALQNVSIEFRLVV